MYQVARKRNPTLVKREKSGVDGQFIHRADIHPASIAPAIGAG
jgi:hypothetical protein